jgi:hypothetical protein
MDYRWCHFYPFRSFSKDASEFEVDLVIRNHLFKEAGVEVTLRLPDDVVADKPSRSFSVPPKTAVSVPFRLRRQSDFGRRRVVTADITINGNHLGEVAEALID